MIELNGVKFAKGRVGLTDEVQGYYKTLNAKKTGKMTIFLYNLEDVRIGYIANGVLGGVDKRKGRYYYFYGNPALIGEFESHQAECEAVERAVKAAGGNAGRDIYGFNP